MTRDLINEIKFLREDENKSFTEIADIVGGLSKGNITLLLRVESILTSYYEPKLEDMDITCIDYKEKINFLKKENQTLKESLKTSNLQQEIEKLKESFFQEKSKLTQKAQDLEQELNNLKETSNYLSPDEITSLKNELVDKKFQIEDLEQEVKEYQEDIEHIQSMSLLQKLFKL